MIRLHATSYLRKFFLVAMLMSAAALPKDTDHACLFSDNDDTSQEVGCVNDPLELAKLDEIEAAIAAYKIENAVIVFKGCTSGRFKTESHDNGLGTNHYQIYYIVDANKESKDDYIAPLIHELGHVFQIEKYGSIEKLREKFSIKKIELGADFLAGVIFSNYIKNNDLDKFQHNLQLIGKYVEADDDAHGTPTERVSAFRTGVFLPFKKYHSNIGEANEYFQDDAFGRITYILQ